MKKFIFLLLLLMLMAASGCQGTKSQNEAYDLRKDKTAPNNVSNRFTGPDRGRIIGNDVNNQNPNFLNLKGTRDGNVAGNSQSIGKDIDKAKQVIRDTHEFTTDSIWVNGERMWVNAYKKGMLTGRERLDAQARLHKLLTLALPRYDIEVKVQEDRR